jgi:tRNA (Thr-GGU) A37 N-methylase
LAAAAPGQVVVAIEGTRMLVSELEALDGTPVIDVKPII